VVAAKTKKGEGGLCDSRWEADVHHDTRLARLLGEVLGLAVARHRISETGVRELARDLAGVAVGRVADDHAEALSVLKSVPMNLEQGDGREHVRV
jgi:hypothetical protein